MTEALLQLQLPPPANQFFQPFTNHLVCHRDWICVVTSFYRVQPLVTRTALASRPRLLQASRSYSKAVAFQRLLYSLGRQPANTTAEIYLFAQSTDRSTTSTQLLDTITTP